MNLRQYTPEKPFAQAHLLRLSDYTSDEILQVLAVALKLKERLRAGLPTPVLAGATLGMIFSKSSTRTRVSFETGMYQLGGNALFLSAGDIQIGRGETIHDTAKVLSRYLDMIMIRTFAQSDVDDLARYGSIPIINGLTDLLHPCQALSDMLTFYEHIGSFAGKKLAFIGDGNNVAHSLMTICAKLGMHFALACPAGYDPDAAIVTAAQRTAQESGGSVSLTRDATEAASGAHCLYTDVWASMGQESQAEARKAVFAPYQVNDALMALADKTAIFQHCLPAHRGEEVSASVIDGPQSVVFDEAENRLHAQKAVMVLLKKGWVDLD